LENRLESLVSAEVVINKEPVYPDSENLRWKTNPINTGIVRPKPIFLAGISKAYTLIITRLPRFRKASVEDFQFDETVNGTFAELASLCMTEFGILNPKGYRSVNSLQNTKRNMDSVLVRLRDNYGFKIVNSKAVFHLITKNNSMINTMYNKTWF
jgi:hypothetical protein